MAQETPPSVGRRGFLRNAAVAGAAAITVPLESPRGQATVARPATIPPPMSAEAELATPQELEVLTAERTGSDFMVDVIKSLGLAYAGANPGSSFRALHESLINYGGNENPELLTCCHEELSVAMAHGYFKIEGRPLAAMAHGTVGLQHASMAVYNAYCDRAPVFIILGNTLDATMRRPGAEWVHSVQDAAAMVRDYIKWDDTPVSLQHFAESAVRAYKIATTPPMGPVVLVVDSELQERPLTDQDRLHVPKLTLAAPPQGDSGAIAEVARLLVAAEHPVLIVDRAARTPAGVSLLVELAEVLQAAVVDLGGRMNFPSYHPLNQSLQRRASIAAADLVVGLECGDFWGAIHAFRDQLHRSSRPITRPGARLVTITASDLYMKSNYQDFQRYAEVDVAIAADAEATLPSLIEAVKRLITRGHRRLFDERGAAHARARQAAFERARVDATYGWDASPISTARLCVEVWAQVKHHDWSLVSYRPFSGWAQQLWPFERYYHYIGEPGGAGQGYTAPAAVGAALANRPHGRLSVCIQKDGDLMYGPGVLWTAAHHRIPVLSIMHNNRAYHQEVMHVQRVACRRNRGIDRAHIGNAIRDPDIDYAKLAQSMGVYAEGPITDPRDLGPAIRRAIAVVTSGQPALVDVVTQPR